MEDPQNWMPPPVEIKRLYELLSKGEMLELDFVPLPRRPPTPEHTPSPEIEDEEEAAKQREREERERKSVLAFLFFPLLQDVGVHLLKVVAFLQASDSDRVRLRRRASAKHAEKRFHQQTQNARCDEQ